MFLFADGGLEGEDVGVAGIVYEEGCLPGGVADLCGDGDVAARLFGVGGFSLNLAGEFGGDGDEGPGGVALPEPDFGVEGEVERHPDFIVFEIGARVN